MRTSVLAGVCVALLVMCVYVPQPCEAQWESLVGPILTKLSGLWHSNSFDFMDHTCHFRRRPTVRRFKLYHKGKFWCPGWAPFQGTSRTKSRSGAARDATQDFVRQAFQKGLITQEDASAWLKN